MKKGEEEEIENGGNLASKQTDDFHGYDSANLPAVRILYVSSSIFFTPIAAWTSLEWGEKKIDHSLK